MITLLENPTTVQYRPHALMGTLMNLLYAHGISAEDFEFEELDSKLGNIQGQVLVVRCRSTQAQHLYLVENDAAWRKQLVKQLVDDIGQGRFGVPRRRTGSVEVSADLRWVC